MNELFPAEWLPIIKTVIFFLGASKLKPKLSAIFTKPTRIKRIRILHFLVMTRPHLKFFLLLGLTSLSTHLISGHIRMVPDCNGRYDNHFIVLYHRNIPPQAQSHDIPPCHIILVTGQPVFALNYFFYMKSLVWFGRESNQRPSRQSECSTTRLPRWSDLTKMSYT